MMKVLCGILIVICLASCSYTQYAPPFSPTADMDSSYVQGGLMESAHIKRILAGYWLAWDAVSLAWAMRGLCRWSRLRWSW